MNKLNKAGFVRLFRNKGFWVCSIFSLVIGVLSAYLLAAPDSAGSFGRYLSMVFPLMVSFLAALFISMFLGRDYSDGAIRNKLVVGHSRRSIYASNLLVCSVGDVIMCLCDILGFALGWLLKEGVPHGGVTKDDLIAILVGLLTVVSFTAIYLLVVMLAGNRALGVVLCSIVYMFGFFYSVIMINKLSQPEYYEGYSYYDEETGDMVVEPATKNEFYMSGTKRTIAQGSIDVLPFGQMVVFENGSGIKPAKYAVGSAICFAAFTIVGAECFRKKDLK